MRHELYTIPEIARRLRVDIDDINYEIDQGYLKTVTIGTKLRITQAALQAFLNHRRIDINLSAKHKLWKVYWPMRSL